MAAEVYTRIGQALKTLTIALQWVTQPIWVQSKNRSIKSALSSKVITIKMRAEVNRSLLKRQMSKHVIEWSIFLHRLKRLSKVSAFSRAVFYSRVSCLKVRQHSSTSPCSVDFRIRVTRERWGKLPTLERRLQISRMDLCKDSQFRSKKKVVWTWIVTS